MTLRSLGILRAKDVPPIEVILVEVAAAARPYGIKGVGEIGLVPTAGAVAAALHDLDGEWRDDAARCGATVATRRRRRLMADGAPRPGWSARTTTSTRRWPAACRRRRDADDFREILEQVWWRLDAALDLEMLALVGHARRARGAASAGRRRSSTTTSARTRSRAASTSSPTRAPRSACGSSAPTASPTATAPTAPRRGLAENERFLRAGGRGMVGVHAAFTCTDETLEAAAGLAADLGVGVHIHVAEGADDADAGARLARARRATTGCSCTASTSTATLPGTIAHNPR